MNWAQARAHVLARDRLICSYCLDDATEVDHVIPVALQGPFLDPLNLVAACRPCNRSKGDLTPREWFARDWGGRVMPWFQEKIDDGVIEVPTWA